MLIAILAMTILTFLIVAVPMAVMIYVSIHGSANHEKEMKKISDGHAVNMDKIDEKRRIADLEHDAAMEEMRLRHEAALAELQNTYNEPSECKAIKILGFSEIEGGEPLPERHRRMMNWAKCTASFYAEHPVEPSTTDALGEPKTNTDDKK